MKNILPADILANIADIRVLALDIATADNIERIKDYCLTIEARQTQIAADYTAHYRSIVDQLPEVLRKDFAMHDSVIRGFSIDERHNLVLDISGFIQLSIK